MEKFCLGKVVKLHGIDGAVKIATQFDDDFKISSLTKLYTEADEEFLVTRIFKVTDGVVVSFSNFNLEKAKSLIGKFLFIDRNLVLGKIMFEDLKGSEVFFDDGKKLGKVSNVSDFGSAEVLTVDCLNGNELLFPNVSGVIKSFDYKTKKLIVSKKIISEVSDYED